MATVGVKGLRVILQIVTTHSSNVSEDDEDDDKDEDCVNAPDDTPALCTAPVQTCASVCKCLCYLLNI